METFLYQRPQKQDIKLNLIFAYPAIESFALASLSFLNIFKMFDVDEEIYAQRLYCDSKNFSYPPKNADCIGFSVSFEIDILNIIKMLKKYEIPLKFQDRQEDDPIVFAGGPVLMSNPMPFEEFFDFISIGEMSCLASAMEVLKKKNELSRDEILKQLSELDGIYVPKYKKEKINIVRDDLSSQVVYTPILSDKSFFQDTFIIELERGCPKMCNFCLASWLNLPVRFAPFEKIIEAIDLGLKHTNKLALLGAYVGGHPQFDKSVEYISKQCETREIELSISSLRADLSDEELIKTLVKCNQKTATIALEAGSQRLRDLIKKDLTEQEILTTLKTAQIGGLKGMKIYTMIGLPTETDEDIQELVEIVKKMKAQVKEIMKEHSTSNFEITISASNFIPKAHTPFENTEMCDKKTLKNRIEYLKKAFHKMGVQFRSSSIEWDMVQSILSRYDKPLSDFLIDVVENGGNIGAFKQLWRSYSKKGLLPMGFEEIASSPFSNIKAPEWDCINTGASEYKINRQKQLLDSL